MSLSSLSAISPLDGRYHSKTAALAEYVSEYALIKYRVLVEIRWLQKLAATSDIQELSPLTSDSSAFLEQILSDFTPEDAARVKEIERTTNHDVKAVEYFLKEKVAEQPQLHKAKEFLHFACTSEDINNLAYALMMADARENVLLPKLNELQELLIKYAEDYAELAMLSRTHGQAASPTTLGKEIANVAFRLHTQTQTLKAAQLYGKFNGAVGNYNAHTSAYPDIDWPKLSQEFIESLGLEYNPYTTQIEPHDFIAVYNHALTRINTLLIDFSRDVWAYISNAYFKQRVIEGEVGSSTMPHKVNPIDFENAEGNFGLANAMLEHLATKLPISRWQRDLSDSTVLRNFGVGLGYSLLAYDSLLRGLNKLEVNPNAMLADLDANWEVLAEPIQTVMRRYAIDNAYEQLKALTRGQRLDGKQIQTFIQQLDIPYNDKQRLIAMTPASYLGLATKQAMEVRSWIKNKP